MVLAPSPGAQMNALKLPFKAKGKGKKPAAKKEAPKKPLVAPPERPVLESFAIPQQLSQKLAALRSRRWNISVLQGTFVLLSVLPVLWLAQGLADWSFDLPWIVRAIFLLTDLAILGWLYRRHLH